MLVILFERNLGYGTPHDQKITLGKRGRIEMNELVAVIGDEMRGRSKLSKRAKFSNSEWGPCAETSDSRFGNLIILQLL